MKVRGEKVVRKISGLRWWIVTLVGLATVINYIDRSALAIMWPNISKDLGLVKDQYATIAIFFTIAYAISQSLSGKLYDQVGTRIGFVLSILVWSASAAMHGMARGLASFSIVRFFLGLGEAGNWPGATKSNAEWFPIKERALAQGIFNSGASIGSIISPPLIATLYLLIGWKATFIVIGVLGVLWIIPWLFLNRALPEEHPWITEKEKDFILSGQKADTPGGDIAERVPGWGELLKYRQTWAVLVSRFFIDPIWWLFVFWLPIYLADQFGFDIKQIGLFAWLPYVGAAVGSIFGGWLAGDLIRRGWTTNKARKFTITAGSVIMVISLLLTSTAHEPLRAVLLIAFILFGFQTAMGNIQTLASDFYTGASVGSVAGMGGTTAAVGVIITTKIVPIITVNSYVPFFLLGALLVPLGLLSVFVFSGTIERVKTR